jgi:PadR family transcriptional regulator PadR
VRSRGPASPYAPAPRSRTIGTVIDLYGREGGREPIFGAGMPRATVPNTNAMLRDFFLGFIKVHVLHHASKGPLYGVWFLEELSKHGYQLSPGTLYPLLHGLEAEGYLEREERVVEGKVRKYYGITALGERALREARAKIGELVEEISEDDEPSKARPREARAAVAARR